MEKIKGENKKRKEGIWMKKYSFPAVEIFEISAEDVIATSGGANEIGSLKALADVLDGSNQTSWDAGVFS